MRRHLPHQTAVYVWFLRIQSLVGRMLKSECSNLKFEFWDSELGNRVPTATTFSHI